MSKGLLVVFSSPTGGGKDALIKALLKKIPHSSRNITTTSRPPRPGNVEGVDYYFVSEEEFEKKIARGDFIEYVKHTGNYYGTDKATLERLLRTHEVVFTQLDIPGKIAFDQLHIPHLSIFILPENLEVLRERIIARGGLTREEVEERLIVAKHEIGEAGLYDLQIVNKQGEFEETVGAVFEAIQTALLKRQSPLTR